ncbi:ribonucleoside-diphosphate reductase subunit alpha [Sinimarinibacterium sp. NLF-5-8]|uniref:ribonucleoside-diphosphate reductase subunit alpha n=1 Tax=Sinimarinibacterium sp. NLF-5-8 TaxID=2698684 RepID=UPI00137C2CCB|nr:ribonucleoside-diphosphate reductase subunit alpha [Sinimarinibacterium sp. NLF-5-8]QHS09945.1 ribonucleoside-diphosphate reductase subunit alpha [Sinimarinibacterium sp. NLF-5-8]
MQTDLAATTAGQHLPHSPATPPGHLPSGAELAATAPGAVRVIRRNGKLTAFDASKIQIAMTKAFLAVDGAASAASASMRQKVEALTEQVVQALLRRLSGGGTLHIEDIQDQVELALMRGGEHKVARAYVLYREEQNRKRAAEAASQPASQVPTLTVTLADGSTSALDQARMRRVVGEACAGLEAVNAEEIVTAAMRDLYDGIRENELAQALTLAARARIEKEPDYTYVSARLLLDALRHEATTFLGMSDNRPTFEDMKTLYPAYFREYIHKAVELELLDPRLALYDLDALGKALLAERDAKFDYLGLQTLYDRYFIHSNKVRFELPQAFFMRVAMGLAINEIDREAKSVEFYHLLSSFDFMSSTPTLFNSGTLRPQLSSCYLTQVPDDLDGIFGALKDNALLSKYAGGLGNDWTPVRGMGGYIKGTNGRSNGVVPFMKVANDTAVAVNQGGKRKGAVCGYLETWHRDIEEFLELRKNTGDDRRRTHDMNTANWVPDLFMKRVMEDGPWTLFSPDDTPDLHELYGTAFEARYVEYERMAEAGLIQNSQRMPAVQLWRKMLSMLFETGHPWITFKDPCNLRSPQQHVGVVHSSNLCTEITLNTKAGQEIAVCNLGSVNLPAHVSDDGRLDTEKLERTINTAMRMLDNVIEYNYYSVATARNSNLRHRPVGLGVMGFNDALYKLRLPYESDKAIRFADVSMEAISYFTIKASTDLAAERGRYSSFEGSLWSQGVLPIDSIKLLTDARGGYNTQDTSTSGNFDWDALRERVKTVGMRNSNTMAIAPTATIANITGVSQSIEPTYQNLYVKSNLSGEFTVVNEYLVRDLKKLDLWDEVMAHDLKYFDGSVQSIDRVPPELKAIYKCAFEVDPKRLVDAASRRQKWIDQAQSLNLYMAQPSGKKLDELYKHAWTSGLKTTYYLRSVGATHAEKTTINDGRLNAVGNAPSASSPAVAAAPIELELPTLDAGTGSAKVCSILDPDCEACQ